MDVWTRNLVFGIQDAAVTTLGIMAGIALSSVPRRSVIRVVGISILVSAVSMGIGSYQSERTAENFAEQGPRRWDMFIGALIMAGCYLVTGAVLLIPYFLTTDTKVVIGSAILISLAMLFVAGWVTSGLANRDQFSNAAETSGLGLVALVIGFLSGWGSKFLEKGKYSTLAV